MIMEEGKISQLQTEAKARAITSSSEPANDSHFAKAQEPAGEKAAEKGVDTAIATDMIRLAWEKAYDVAVLASSDGDLVPAVEFLDLKGARIIQAGFYPRGS